MHKTASGAKRPTCVYASRYIQFVKTKIYILIISILFLSCQTKDREGVWVCENEEWNSYVLAKISNDSLTLKYLTFNYYLSNKTQLFIEEEINTFSNDSFKIEVNLTDSLELITYKNDRLIEIEKFYKLNQYSPNLNLSDLKNELNEKSILYEMEDYKVHIDIIDSIRTYNYNIEKTPMGFNYFDIFEFGNEIFFILDTGNPLPIQLIDTEENDNQMYITTELLNQKGRITINKRSRINELIQGTWKTQSMNINEKESINNIIINQDSFIVNWKNKKQNGFKISALSKDSLYYLRTNEINPFLLRIEPVNMKEMIITNYRNRQKSKMKLIKK